MKRKTKLGPYVFPGTVTATVGGYRLKQFSLIEAIFRAVEYDTGITREQIKGKDRYRKIKEARQLFHYLADKLTSETKQAVGKCTHNDHSTVIHSINTLNNVMTYNEKLIDKVKSIELHIEKMVKVNEKETVNKS